ncbi:LysE family translocator [Dickeya solani]|uniref:LysE type translocator protein n=1 Tax=Dickeya solani D s0432-1 TaxID=1231725 RepID=A0AAV3KFU2_9GAMM|nr:LysE family transporter [Dickeya solani]ANE76090.1 lysine transporter LysE [Dickeya solani IPO 2222]AUC43632.1 Putative threonine efflux protein [Dickeya solani RNS 08.23.3.1.A]AUH08501.1 lysine transporter LysE [Dickeya solani D s0432-1]AUH12499.1 lysine transporter LysE [Dickeya solani]AYQ46539.1 threonine efflux system [Dickeya solani]
MLLVMLSGLLLSLSLCLDLGIVNTAIINRGVRDGAGAAFFIGLGSCFGDLIYATLSVLGMAVIFNYTPVRWLLWIGGGGVLLWLSFNMARSAWRDYRQHRGLPIDTATVFSPRAPSPAHRDFISGMGMALASPSALLWFAAVGGTLIAQATDGSARQVALFLGGFFIGGVLWTLFMALLIQFGRGALKGRLSFYCSALSAVLFAVFAAQVIVNGYQTLLTPAS